MYIKVTTSRTEKVGFTSDKARLNVMLTRARRHFIIVGNIAVLSSSELWAEILLNCEAF